MSPLSVLVVEDEPLARRRLVRMLGRLDWVGPVDEAADAVEGGARLAAGRPDILLLDIQMPRGSGFDLLRQAGPNPPAVVFVTAFDHHALAAFEAEAIDYLTKPVEPARFDAALARARQAVEARQHADRITELQETVAVLKAALNRQHARPLDFWVRQRGDHVRIPSDAILCLQAERDYVRIHARGGAHLYLESLSSIERKLDPQAFVRVHRSTIVRCGAVVRLKPAAFSALVVVLDDGSEVRVSRTHAATVRARFMRD